MICTFTAGEKLVMGHYVRPDRDGKMIMSNRTDFGVCLNSAEPGEIVSVAFKSDQVINEPQKIVITNGNSLSNMGTSLFEDYIIIIAKYAVMTGFVLICLAGFMAICSVRMCQ